MRIGIIGLGSIGQRHARCLKQLGIEEIIALRTKAGSTKELPEEFHYIKEVKSPKEFYSLNLDGVIISNPTSLHISSMKLPLEKRLPTFIEKPIAVSLEETKQIEKFNTSNVMVGYNLRYNDVVQIVKGFIDSGKLGKIFKASLYCGQYLPFWHPYADYREEYYSRRDLGGGALRSLSHEIDLMHYFFGQVVSLNAVVEKISNLEIDADDNVNMTCKMENSATVKIELDYLNPTLERFGKIFGEMGKLEYSISDPMVIFFNFDGESKILYQKSDLDTDHMYLVQMKEFFNFIRNNNRPVCDFRDGVNVMKVIKAAEDSAQTKCWTAI